MIIEMKQKTINMEQTKENTLEDCLMVWWCIPTETNRARSAKGFQIGAWNTSQIRESVQKTNENKPFLSNWNELDPTMDSRSNSGHDAQTTTQIFEILKYPDFRPHPPGRSVLAAAKLTSHLIFFYLRVLELFLGCFSRHFFEISAPDQQAPELKRYN